MTGDIRDVLPTGNELDEDIDNWNRQETMEDTLRLWLAGVLRDFYRKRPSDTGREREPK